ncbi:MAG: FeoB-associated Cys-rich membrane protein [Pyrinomonadaceae bacterium]
MDGVDTAILGMDIQTLIVFAAIAAAVGFAALWLVRKARAFSVKKDCGDDCGCGKTTNNG